MNDVATKTEYTPEDLLTMPDGEQYELVNGALVERHMGWWAGIIAGACFASSPTTTTNTVSDGSTRGATAPTCRSPKAAGAEAGLPFVRFGRIPGERPPTGQPPRPRSRRRSRLPQRPL